MGCKQVVSAEEAEASTCICANESRAVISGRSGTL